MSRLTFILLASLLSLNVRAESWINGYITWPKQRDLGLLQSGIIQKLNVKLGDFVQSGQLLVQLDNRALKAQQQAHKTMLQAQQTVYKQALSNWKRTKDLHEQVLIAQHEMEQADSKLALAKAKLAASDAQVQQDQQNLRESQLKAPFAGVISAIYVDLGQAINNQQQISPLLQLRDIQQLQINSRITAEQAQGLNIGQQLQINTKNQLIQATIKAIIWQQNHYQLQLQTNKQIKTPLIQIKLP